MIKVVTIIGARPQFIKASAVSRIISQHSNCSEVIVHTGQHFDQNMSEVFFTELDIPKPQYNLGIGGGSHGEMTGRQLEAIEKVLIKEKPHWVMVYGDTNSTLAGALAAAKLYIPIAHVEAGLRSFNKRMPEEINRVLTDHVSSVLFCPTVKAVENLKNESVNEKNIALVGDVMFDAALYFGNKAQKESRILSNLKIEVKEYILGTIHRAENTEHRDRLHNIVSVLNELSERQRVIWPMHPRTKKSLHESGLISVLSSKVTVIDPLGYIDMVMLEQNAAVILTDSGGVQKEAFFYRVPCVTIRDETEWTELVESGWNHLASAGSISHIMTAVNDAMGSQGKKINPYGNGDASAKIIETLLRGIE